MKWGIALGVLLLAAAAWPADAPPVRLPSRPEAPVVAPPSVPEPSPAPPEKSSGRAGRSRDPEDPPPPPEPPRPKPLGTVFGNVEDESGGAIHSYRISSRRYGHRGRSSAGEGTVGPGGTYRFRVRKLNFGPPDVPPGCEPDRSLFTIWADGYVGGSFRLDEDVERALRRRERVTGVRIVLERAVVVEGRIFMPDGHPARGHWLAAYRRKSDGKQDLVSWIKSGGDGWFRFCHLRPEPNLYIHATARRGKPDRVAQSPYLPVGDDPAPGEIVHIDVRLGPWTPKK